MRFFIIPLFIILFTFTPAAKAEIDEGELNSVTVLASSSLMDVLTELVRLYSVRAETTISVSYSSPSDLAHDIESGDLADVYISEHEVRMQDLKRQGLIDVYSFSNIASNRLVLVAHKDHLLSKKFPETVTLEKSLSDFKIPEFVIGDPDNAPIGILGHAALEKLGLWKKVEPYLVRTADSRSALYLIANGQRAGIVYYTDTVGNPDLRIISYFPEELHDQPVYQAAVVAGENMQNARKFLDFMKSDEAKKIFTKYGFSGV